MKHTRLAKTFFLGIAAVAQAQQVRLAKVGLGMTEAELKQALESSSPSYTERSSSYPNLRSLLAVTKEESFLLTFIDEKVAAFSLVHLIPAGQQPFLPAGQEPTVKVLRELVIKQTWTPASVDGGDVYWLSDRQGAPLTTPGACQAKGSVAWRALAPSETGNAPSTMGLLEPAVLPYPAECGVSIHLRESPSATENDRVTKVEIQVADLKALNTVATKR